MKEQATQLAFAMRNMQSRNEALKEQLRAAVEKHTTEAATTKKQIIAARRTVCAAMASKDAACSEAGLLRITKEMLQRQLQAAINARAADAAIAEAEASVAREKFNAALAAQEAGWRDVSSLRHDNEQLQEQLQAAITARTADAAIAKAQASAAQEKASAALEAQQAACREASSLRRQNKQLRKAIALRTAEAAATIKPLATESEQLTNTAQEARDTAVRKSVLLHR